TPLQGGCGRFDSFSAHESTGDRPVPQRARIEAGLVPHLSRTSQAKGAVSFRLALRQSGRRNVTSMSDRHLAGIDVSDTRYAIGRLVLRGVVYRLGPEYRAGPPLG